MYVTLFFAGTSESQRFCDTWMSCERPGTSAIFDWDHPSRACPDLNYYAGRGHHLVTDGVCNRVRHPMYLACLIFALGQALAVLNDLAGPSFLIGVILLFG